MLSLELEHNSRRLDYDSIQNQTDTFTVLCIFFNDMSFCVNSEWVRSQPVTQNPWAWYSTNSRDKAAKISNKANYLPEKLIHCLLFHFIEGLVDFFIFPKYVKKLKVWFFILQWNNAGFSSLFPQIFLHNKTAGGLLFQCYRMSHKLFFSGLDDCDSPIRPCISLPPGSAYKLSSHLINKELLIHGFLWKTDFY